MIRKQFIDKVMLILNEAGWNDTSGEVFFGSDRVRVETHIEDVFIESWRKAVQLFPQWYFSFADFSSTPTADISEGVGYIFLPTDFHKLVSFKIKGWQCACKTLLPETDTIAQQQANEYVRGNFVRPVCVRRTAIKKERVGDAIDKHIRPTLHYYSLPKGTTPHEVEEAIYIPLIGKLSTEPTISEHLFEPLAYLVASLVSYIFEKYDLAKILETKAIEIVNTNAQ